MKPLTKKQQDVFDCIGTTWRTALETAERTGLDHTCGSLTHWIRPELKALVKKGFIQCSKVSKAGPNKGRNYYKRIKVEMEKSNG